MGFDPITLAVVAIGSSIGSSVMQQREAKKAASAQREGQARILAEERKRAETENLRSLRQQIRQQRIAQSSMVNQAALTGGVGGSAVAGATSAAAAQTAGNISYMQDISEINTNIGNIQMDIANRVAAAQSRGATYGAIGGLAGTIFSQMDGFKTIFKGSSAPIPKGPIPSIGAGMP